jgi:carbon monoxide dehydrogenase subunit G
MKINGKQDIDVPLEFAVQILSDIQGWERAAMRRGMDVRRTDRLAAPGVGAAWSSRFSFRGKTRHVDLKLVELSPSGQMTVSFQGKSAEGTATLTPLAMGARRTRISATLDVRARSLSARLLFQSMRLARNRVVSRFEQRLALFCFEIESRYRAAGK